MRLLSFYFSIFLYLFPTLIHAFIFPGKKIDNKHQQLLVVNIANDLQNKNYLQRFERLPNDKKWIATGKPILVINGKNGISSKKREGDNYTPSGIYKLGPAFGFSTQSINQHQFPYLSLHQSMRCIDDPHSTFYNKLVNRDKIIRPDWQHSESMYQSAYQLGIVIRYNDAPGKDAKGSCIFIHRWQSHKKDTAGCIAMKDRDLEVLLRWLDPKKQPLIAILPV